MCLFWPFSSAAQVHISVSAQGGAKQKRVSFSRPGLAGTMALPTGGCRSAPLVAGLLDARYIDRPPCSERTCAMLGRGPAVCRMRS